MERPTTVKFWPEVHPELNAEFVIAASQKKTVRHARHMAETKYERVQVGSSFWIVITVAATIEELNLFQLQTK